MNKKIRMKRLFNCKSGKTFLLPIDHGITLGPIKGIDTYHDTVKLATCHGVNTIVAHKGTIKKLLEEDIYGEYSYMMHLSASTTLSPSTHHKVLVTQVEEALSYGVDGISVHVNLGGEADTQMLKDFGQVSYECEKWGIPLLAMMYAPGGETDIQITAHLIKIAQEIGADMVKINYGGDLAKMERYISGTGISVVLAGGSCTSDMKNLLTRIDQAMQCGFSGVAIGRNVFQLEEIELYTQLISDLVNQEASLDICLERLEEQGYDNSSCIADVCGKHS